MKNNIKKLLTSILLIALISVSVSAFSSCANESATDNKSGTSEEATVRAPQTENPETENVTAFIKAMFESYNNKDYDKYLANFNYDEEKKSELKSTYESMEKLSVSTYEFKKAEIMPKTEGQNMMVKVEFNMTATSASDTSDITVYDSTVYYQLIPDGESYLVTSSISGTVYEIN